VNIGFNFQKESSNYAPFSFAHNGHWLFCRSSHPPRPMPRRPGPGSSGVGDDANPCSRTAPCKTFAGAISKTAAAGEINCLDPRWDSVL